MKSAERLVGTWKTEGLKHLNQHELSLESVLHSLLSKLPSSLILDCNDYSLFKTYVSSLAQIYIWHVKQPIKSV